MEASIGAGVAMYILQLFTNEAPFYAEILTAGATDKVFILGHAGYHNDINHDKKY